MRQSIQETVPAGTIRTGMFTLERSKEETQEKSQDQTLRINK
jgi:hypothetical protein